MQQYESLGDNMDDEIDLLEIMGIIFKRKVLVISITVIVSLIGIIVGGINYYNGKSVNSIIGYNYDGISKGLNIDGSQFTTRDIKNTVVVRKVYNEYPILKEKGISLTEFMSAIKINGIVPNDISNLAENTLKKGQKFVYNPVDYKITLKLTNNTDLDSEILTSLVSECIKYFNYKYKGNETAPSIKIEDYTTYDYSDRVKIIGTNINVAKKMVKRLSDKDFVSKNVGLAYEDITAMLKSIEEVDLKNISSSINVSNITNNINERKLVLDNKIKELKLEKNKAIVRTKVLKDMLENYKPNNQKMIIPSLSETGMKISTEDEYYTKLLKNYEKSAINTKVLEIEIQEQELKKSELSNENIVVKEKITKDIENVIYKYNKIAEKINVMNQEYYNRYFANSVRVISPTSVTSNSKAKIIILASIILGAMLGLGSAFLAELKDQYYENKSDAKNKNNIQNKNNINSVKITI
ncbi:hypothetical protein [Fusobacterium sp. IOR10]|uniref:hypothetical protein n=1 Tax=Fusobacterium sp. IOR10 TaxID=2665157 RepID=UPI0013D32F5D|nr:hypothetical protein [Fusobacterium sp. IOR10]